MQRQRGELVPIGEALADLPGHVKAIREATPQALHHFTQADQVNQLVTAREADPDRGFMARTMALCSLPRTNPGNRLQYKRHNGPFTLYMIAGGGNKLPYGNLPRLLLAWVCTEAVRTQSRELVPACQNHLHFQIGDLCGLASVLSEKFLLLTLIDGSLSSFDLV